MNTRVNTRETVKEAADDAGWVLERGNQGYDFFRRDHERMVVYFSTTGGISVVAHHYADRVRDEVPVYTSRYLGPWDRDKRAQVVCWLAERSLVVETEAPLFTVN